MRKYRVLSIDAWRAPEGGWTWNNWFHVNTLETLPDDTRALLKLLRSEGILTDASKGTVAIEDDGYNVVVVDKSTREPIIAIEYGNED